MEDANFISQPLSWNVYRQRTGIANVQQCIDELKRKYPSGWRSSAGDGNCFYYAFIFGFLQMASRVNIERWYTMIQPASLVLASLNYIQIEDGIRCQTAVRDYLTKGTIDFITLTHSLRILLCHHLLTKCLNDNSYLSIVRMNEPNDGTDTINTIVTNLLKPREYADAISINLLIEIFKIAVVIEEIRDGRCYTLPQDQIWVKDAQNRDIHVEYLIDSPLYLLRRNENHYDYIIADTGGNIAPMTEEEREINDLTIALENANGLEPEDEHAMRMRLYKLLDINRNISCQVCGEPRAATSTIYQEKGSNRTFCGSECQRGFYGN